MPVLLKESIYRVRNMPRSEAILMGRAELLRPQERELIESAVIRGLPITSIARVMDVPPQAIRKRVYRLGRRITSRRFLDAARALPYLGRAEAELARRYFCEGIPQRELSRQLCISVHALRRRLDRLVAEIAAIRRIQRRTPRIIPAPASRARGR